MCTTSELSAKTPDQCRNGSPRSPQGTFRVSIRVPKEAVIPVVPNPKMERFSEIRELRNFSSVALS